MLLLNETPAINSGLYYAGWDRYSQRYKYQTTMLHHPKGDVMKISVDDGAPVAMSWNSMQVWKLTWDVAGVQKGSSGGPFFDQNYRTDVWS